MCSRWKICLRSTRWRSGHYQEYECQPRHQQWLGCQNQTVLSFISGLDQLLINAFTRRDYKSEYKQRFRPFSQYEYLGDGRFIPSPNGQITPPTNTTASKSSSVSKQQKQQQQDQQKAEQHQLALQQRATSLQGEPWYREVVELRRQANDYKVFLSLWLTWFWVRLILELYLRN